MANLPKNVTVKDYQGDLVMTGPNMTAAIYNDLKKAMPAEDQQQLIGWIRTGR